MGLITKKKLPDWLDDETIKMLKNDIINCSNPYTEEEVKSISFDGNCDMYRYRAYVANKVLSEYGLLEENTDE